nr:hypothetical protein [uncultured Janthinobacterium sp.]
MVTFEKEVEKYASLHAPIWRVCLHTGNFLAGAGPPARPAAWQFVALRQRIPACSAQADICIFCFEWPVNRIASICFDRNRKNRLRI